MTRPPIEGLIVVGATARCGKTALTAGIASAMLQEGFRVQAIKPLEFLPVVSLLKGQDQAYMDKMTRQTVPFTPVCVESPYHVANLAWTRVVECCRKMTYPTLIESPGSVASPLRWENGEMLDVADLAFTLGVPVLLVVSKTPRFLSEAMAALAYLQSRQVEVMGWVAVETHPAPKMPQWDEETFYLTRRFVVPHLGELAYSPSISVESLQQGNLIKLTEMGIDLLPLLKAMQMVLS